MIHRIGEFERLRTQLIFNVQGAETTAIVFARRLVAYFLPQISMYADDEGYAEKIKALIKTLGIPECQVKVEGTACVYLSNFNLKTLPEVKTDELQKSGLDMYTRALDGETCPDFKLTYCFKEPCQLPVTYK